MKSKRVGHKRKRRDTGTQYKTKDVEAIDAIDAPLQMYELPDAAMQCIASFLPFNYKVAFAMSLPTWKEARTSDVSKTIIGSEKVESLDFLELGKEMASKLTDADLNHILVSIDAVYDLTDLKLTHCYGVNGHGLRSLSGSMTLEAIDLSLVKDHDLPSEGYIGLISTEQVLPILNSILDAEECSLRYIQLPLKWRDYSDEYDVDLIQFVSRYNNLTIICDNCDGGDNDRGIFDGGFGIETRTCYECSTHYCYDCIAKRGRALGPCAVCERSRCLTCCDVEICYECDEKLVCEGCLETDGNHMCCWLCPDCVFECEYCHLRGCRECLQIEECDECAAVLCAECDGAAFCGGCSERKCISCLLGQDEDELDCVDCYRRMVQHLKKENKRLKRKVNALTKNAGITYI